jgi:hypothetical protein
MGTESIGHNRRVSDHLHPLVYKLIVGLAAIFIWSALAFARDSYAGYLLTVVSGFVVITLALPYLLGLIWRTYRGREESQERRESFGDWASDDFGTWQDRVKGANAAIEILLPLAAVAFGMVAFAIVEHFT